MTDRASGAGRFELRSEQVLVRGDAGHGGELLDLIDLRTGEQVLGRPPFHPAEPVRGELDEATWTRSYRGGWQLLVPNAGNACVDRGIEHGLHGRASTEPWRLELLEPASASLSWEGHGLRVERELVVRGRVVAIRSRAVATGGPVSMIAVEHCALGAALIEPGFSLELAPGRAYELSETAGPVRAPADAPTWPLARMLDGRVEQSDAWSFEAPVARLLAVQDLPHGWARVRRVRGGAMLELRWAAEVLPHAWVWIENQATQPIWGREARIVGIEPASVPHGLGLAEAVAHGQAIWLGHGDDVEWWIEGEIGEHDGQP